MKIFSFYSNIYEKYICLLLGFFMFSASVAQQSQVVNTYGSVTGMNLNTNTLTVSNANAFSPCGKALLIQMQGAQVATANDATFGNVTNYASAGNYEFVNIAAINGNQVILTSPIQRAYSIAEKVQLVSVPQYSDVTFNNVITCPQWNTGVGVGGVIVMEATGIITLNANIDASGMGFNGGTINLVQSNTACSRAGFFYSVATADGAGKGEGICILPANMLNGRGKNANGGGGGNGSNSGGAGGGNYGAGGDGGVEARVGSCTGTSIMNGGVGGNSMSLVYNNLQNRIFLGGGGGAGQQNDGNGTTNRGSSPGASGGGIIIIKAQSIVTNGIARINSYGLDAAPAFTDGSGGGGAGGTVLLEIGSTSPSLIVDIHGGNGGNNAQGTGNVGAGDQGAGGGGGGGVLWTTTNFTGTVINVGGQGGSSNTNAPNRVAANDGFAGTVGGILTGLVMPENYDTLHPFIAIGDSLPSTICIGSSITVAVGGGAYGRLIVDGNDVSGVLETSSDTLFIPVTVDGTTAGVKHVCYVSYSVNPDSVTSVCSDTVCYDVTVGLCHCDNIIPVMARDSSAPAGTYVFYDANANNIQANVLTWIVDGDTAELTTGNGTFTYQPPIVGVHVICMTAAYIRPVNGSYSECCYVTICDTIDYDNCELWRATDSIIFSIDSNNYQNINFTYNGTAPTSMQWDFGDGSAIEVNTGQPINHIYSNDGTYTVCAYLVWSIPTHENCCCVDTICFAVNVSPCELTQFSISIADSSFLLGYRFQLNPIGQYPTNLSVHWLSPINQWLGQIAPYYSPNTNGLYQICADVSYRVNGVNCIDNVCEAFSLQRRGINILTFFPNPAMSYIVVEIDNETNEQSVSLTVTNMLGQVYYSNDFKNLRTGINSIYVDISKFTKGVYSVVLQMGNDKLTGKMIKE